MTASTPPSPLAINNRPVGGLGLAHIMATIDTVTRSSPGLSAPTLSPDGVRLRLRANLGSGFVDGGWWPRSGNLSTELPPLLKAMWSAGHQVYRVTYDLASWDLPPRRMTVTGRPVKIDGYRSDGPMLSLIDQSGWKRIDLVVIPPGTDAQVAHRALDLAGLDGDLHRAQEILHKAVASKRPTLISRDGCLEPPPVGDWETDGGRVLVSSQR
jgi:Family of unknown function (DUF5994)